MSKKAVVVGMRYDDGIDCRADADAIGAVLIACVGMLPENVHVLHSPTRQAVEDTIRLASVGVSDMFAFFYSGHGMDTAPTSSLCLANGDRLAGDELGQILGAAEGVNKLVLLNMCFAGGAVQVPFRVQTDDSMAVIAACRFNEAAQGPLANGLSPMIARIVQKLRAPGGEGVTPESLHAYLHRHAVRGQPVLAYRRVRSFMICAPEGGAGGAVAHVVGSAAVGGIASAAAKSGAAEVSKQTTEWAAKELAFEGLAQVGQSGLKRIADEGAKRSAGIVLGNGAQIVVHNGATFAMREGATIAAEGTAKILTEGTGRVVTQSVVKAGAKDVAKKGVKAVAISGAVIEGALVVGFLVKDSADYADGKISGEVLAKRTARNTLGGGGSVGGAIAGQALIPIPFVGAMIGGVVGSLVGKGLSWGFGWFEEGSD